MKVNRIRPAAPAPVAEAEDAREQRVALTRMLIWAEQECLAQGCGGAAAHLRAAIEGLRDPRQTRPLRPKH